MTRLARLPHLAAGTIILQAVFLFAAEDVAKEPTPPPIPFAAVNIAGADRLLSDTEFMFKIIDRPDMFQIVQSLVGQQMGDLKGFDRTKPLGVMFFLEPGFPPRPMPVVYLPAKNMDELMETIGLSPFRAEKVVGQDRYELHGPGPTQYAQFRNGYAFVTASEILIDEELPDPVEYNRTLTSRYDIALALRIKAIPPLLRDVFLGFLRSQTEAELQRRDDEPEAAYRLRRANGVSTLEALQELLTEGDQITIGIDGNQELRKAVIEMTIQATPDSAYAKSLHDLAGRPSYFRALQSDTDKPLTVSVSWLMNKREKKAAAESVEAGRIALARLFKERMLDDTSINTLCDVLQATAEEGHFDGFLQIGVPKPGQFIVSAGFGLNGAESAGTAIQHLLSQLSTVAEVTSIDQNLESHQGIAFHRIQPNNDDDDANRFFGGKPSFWFGAGHRALWFAAGGDLAVPNLKDSIDRVLQAGPPPEGPTNPFVLVLRRAAWMSMAQPEDRPWEADFRAVANEAFNSSNDTLRVETRPTENGIRTRVELDEGFIRWLGLQIARAFDRSQL